MRRVSGQRLARNGLEWHVRSVRPSDIAAGQKASIGHESKTPDPQPTLERNTLLSGSVVVFIISHTFFILRPTAIPIPACSFSFNYFFLFFHDAENSKEKIQ
jgi:hypothetical protein